MRDRDLNPGRQEEFLISFVSYLCLVYHEARNVRHLLAGGHRESGPYERLRMLPTNRDQAWTALQGLRTEAQHKEGAAAATEVFERNFGLSPEDLLDLYEDPKWKDASRIGGYPWGAITRAVVEARDAIDRGDEEQAVKTLSSMADLPHNTGRLGDKIGALDDMIKRGSL